MISDKPYILNAGATAAHARLILLALLPLVEDSGSASLLAAPLERAEFQIFSRDKQVRSASDCTEYFPKYDICPGQVHHTFFTKTVC